MKQASVILVRENAEQLTGSGCCGKLEGDNACVDGKSLFTQSEHEKSRLGVLYRAVRESFSADQVELVQVDPRNQLYLAMKLLRDVWRYRPGLRASFNSVFQVFALPAVIVNGHVLSRRGQTPSADELLDHIHRVVEAPETVLASRS